MVCPYPYIPIRATINLRYTFSIVIYIVPQYTQYMVHNIHMYDCCKSVNFYVLYMYVLQYATYQKVISEYVCVTVCDISESNILICMY